MPDRHDRGPRGGLPQPAALVVVLAIAVVIRMPAPGHAAARPVVGVADFYAIGTLPAFAQTDPERYCADALTALAARAGGDALTVLPRAEMRGAEAALGWRTSDALRFSRLTALAQAAHADRLLVGWIKQADTYHQSFFEFDGHAVLDTQVFDARQGRITWERETEGYGMAPARGLALEEAFDSALARAARAAAAAAASAPPGGPSAPPP